MTVPLDKLRKDLQKKYERLFKRAMEIAEQHDNLQNRFGNEHPGVKKLFWEWIAADKELQTWRRSVPYFEPLPFWYKGRIYGK